MKQVLAKRFLQFCDNLRGCQKIVIRDTFEKIRSDVRTTTGYNLTELSLLLKKHVSKLHPSDAQRLDYETICDEDCYRISFINELLDVQHGNSYVAGFSNDDLTSILHYLCSA